MGQKRVSVWDISVNADMATGRGKKRTTHPLRVACVDSRARKIGAGEGNRTLLVGLGSRCITTMLRPHPLYSLCHFQRTWQVDLIPRHCQSARPNVQSINVCQVSGGYPPSNPKRFAPAPIAVGPARHPPATARAQSLGTASRQTSARFHTS